MTVKYLVMANTFMASALRLPSGRPALRFSSDHSIHTTIAAGTATNAFPMLASADLSQDLMVELNKPPVTLNPFSISPIGYCFFAGYLLYISWQIFGPVSEEEAAVEASRVAAAAEEAEKSDEFLAAAAAEFGAKVTPSGLVFLELEAGTGEYPSPSQAVSVHYTGCFADGKVFDSSLERGKPTEFKLNQVIGGWAEGLQLMRKGSKARLTIPAKLAYGPLGTNAIPGNAALQFEVELLDVKEGGWF
mmetsp:Transcript_33734/g.55699  ORF Transcript_33734/g.55699 Transcript_33734/m.55699 type:complete len:247 (-) Transcript_33734:421-1161(-)|eukprot:CAMPEP_0119313268 /NCGR_PEP_ID=MMETSP1333-20130426/28563_1 /TAXON_ID=418940 /ORGANISM="Scyphosphaera apsteinii, Strain RCC1455" /LENGTH=246 /DNA_ID=CAMNT_0007318069 /DNA_START=16 /DNA_END=756 /DNA_ORIENTATION=-